MLGITGEIQALNLLYACGLGFLLGLWYELFRTVRLLVPPTAKRCFIQDIVFSLGAAFATFFCFLALTDGIMYPYLFFGEAVGFFAFRCTVGRVCHILLASVWRCIHRAFKWVDGQICLPIIAFFKGKLCGFGEKCKRIRRKVQKKPKIARFFSKKP